MRSKYSRGLRALSVATRSGPHAEAVLDAADRVRKRAAAVGEADAQRRQALEHAAEDQAAGGARLFGRHADQPRQPVLGHAVRGPSCPTDAPGSPRPDRRRPRRTETAPAHRGSSLRSASRSARLADRAGRCSVPFPGSPASATAAARCRCRRSGAGTCGRFRRCGRSGGGAARAPGSAWPSTRTAPARSRSTCTSTPNFA